MRLPPDENHPWITTTVIVGLITLVVVMFVWMIDMGGTS